MYEVNVLVYALAAGLAVMGVYRFLLSDFWQTRGKILRNRYRNEQW